MKNLVEEFKAFAMRGNVVDLAVAVVIGAAFGKIVSSLVENIITPLIGILLGGVDFTGWAYTLGEGEEAVVLSYGVFIQSVFDFVVVAFAIFMAIKALKKFEKPAPAAAAPAAPSEDIVLLREIRDSLRR
jgi:large conductance mechanosensitive channel